MAHGDGETGNSVTTAPASQPDTTARPGVDPQTEMLLRMLSDVRQHVTDENVETRRQFNSGLSAVLAEQKFTNGRVNKLEQEVSRIDTIVDERTSNMTCALHDAEFRYLKGSIKDLEDNMVPKRLAEIEKKVKDVITARPERKKSFASKIGITAGSVAGLIYILDGIWTWASKKFGG